MRTLTCLALVCALVLATTPVEADGMPVARIQKVQDVALDAFAGAGVAAAPRMAIAPRFAPRTAVTFGFQGSTRRPAPRLTPPRPIVQPTAFQGFGGFAAKVRLEDPRAAFLRVDDVVEENDVLLEEDVLEERDVVEGKVDACGRVYTEHQPTEVTHQSSYYVPRLRKYYSTSCGTCATTCDDACASSCDPCVRRVYVVRRPVYYSSCYSPCYRPYYRSCYRPYYGGWGPFWNGVGWGVGVGVGFGLAYGW